MCYTLEASVIEMSASRTVKRKDSGCLSSVVATP